MLNSSRSGLFFAKSISAAFALAFAATLAPAQSARELSKGPEAALRSAPKAMQSIRAQDLQKHAFKLASDEFEGRLTGTRGQILAAEYFIKEFKRLKLKPYGEFPKRKNGERSKRRGWTQPYDVRLTGLVPGKTALLDPSGSALHRYGAWFLPEIKDFDLKGTLTFCGGRSRRELKGLTLRSSIAVFTKDLGKESKGYGRGFQLGQKLRAELRGLSKGVKENGGIGMVVLVPKMPASFLSVISYMGLLSPLRPNVSLGHGKKGRNRRFAILGGPRVPCLIVADADADAVLSELGLMPGQSFEDLDKSVGHATKAKYRMRVKASTQDTEAVNVIGLLPGRDKVQKKEAIVYSCHMDHLGVAADGRIFYGADDNASGSSAVLEIAEAYAKLPRRMRPKRSILFVVVSGEELGLWGSAQFTKHPTWPIDKIVADINMDMLGRSTKKVTEHQVALTPTFKHRSFNTLARETAWLGKAFDLEMVDGDRFYGRSDHFNFARKRIPVVFFCDDEHPDYHMVTDTPDKLEYGKIERISRLAFLLGYRWGFRKTVPEKLGAKGSWEAGLGK